MAGKGPFVQRVGVALCLGAAAAALAFALTAPVRAQGFFDSIFGTFPSERRGGGYQRDRGGGYERDRGGGGSVDRTPDSSRAPVVRRVDAGAVTTTVLVLGDSMADWLAYGLDEALVDSPEISVVRKHRTYSGLIRYDLRNDALDWAQAARDMIAADKPSFVVMMLGLNDRQSIRERIVPPRSAPGQAPPAGQPPAAGGAPAASTEPAAPGAPAGTAEQQPKPGQEKPAQPPAAAAPEPQARPRLGASHEFRSEKWEEAYAKRVDETIAALKRSGVPVFWVGLPSVRGPRSTSDMVHLNEIFKARAEKAGIVFIDVWDGFVDEGGRFALQGPDVEGQIRRLRTADGVHFTKAGARKLAHFVEREIKRASLRDTGPVALPAVEPQQTAPAPKPGGPAQRPLAGPVVPLTAPASGSESLLGGGNVPVPVAHVTATRVLVKGEPIDPPAGRGDDFTWPRRGVAAFGTDPVVATTTLPLPVMQPPQQRTVAAPVVESPKVAAATAPRRTPRPQSAPQLQAAPRSSSPFSFFPFFR